MAGALKTLATKLGICDEPKILSKAAEMERLLQSRVSIVKHINDICRIVVCLDLAADMLGKTVDQKLAARLSGVKSSAYINNLHTIENILHLKQSQVTTSQVCLLVQCIEAQTVAEEILERYRKIVKPIDLTMPQYICIAVYEACRLQKIKVSKSKLIEISRLKLAQWTKLQVEWSKFVDDHFKKTKAKKGESTHPKAVTETVESEKNVSVSKSEKQIVEYDLDIDSEEEREKNYEDYKEWKGKILKRAYEEIAKVNKSIYSKETNSRSSPRKIKSRHSETLNHSCRKTNVVVEDETSIWGQNEPSTIQSLKSQFPRKSLSNNTSIKTSLTEDSILQPALKSPKRKNWKSHEGNIQNNKKVPTNVLTDVSLKEPIVLLTRLSNMSLTTPNKKGTTHRNKGNCDSTMKRIKTTQLDQLKSHGKSVSGNDENNEVSVLRRSPKKRQKSTIDDMINSDEDSVYFTAKPSDIKCQTDENRIFINENMQSPRKLSKNYELISKNLLYPVEDSPDKTIEEDPLKLTPRKSPRKSTQLAKSRESLNYSPLKSCEREFDSPKNIKGKIVSRGVRHLFND